MHGLTWMIQCEVIAVLALREYRQLKAEIVRTGLTQAPPPPPSAFSSRAPDSPEKGNNGHGGFNAYVGADPNTKPGPGFKFVSGGISIRVLIPGLVPLVVAVIVIAATLVIINNNSYNSQIGTPVERIDSRPLSIRSRDSSLRIGHRVLDRNLERALVYLKEEAGEYYPEDLYFVFLDSLIVLV